MQNMSGKTSHEWRNDHRWLVVYFPLFLLAESENTHFHSYRGKVNEDMTVANVTYGDSDVIDPTVTINMWMSFLGSNVYTHLINKT